jgi:hypothetical protein
MMPARCSLSICWASRHWASSVGSSSLFWATVSCDSIVRLGQRQVFLGLRQFVIRLIGLALPLLALRRQRGDLRLQTVARFNDVADLGLELADLGVGFIQRALRRVHAVRGIVRRAHRFQLGLDMAQLRGLGFEVDLRLVDRACVALLLCLGLALAQEPQQVLLLFAFGLQLRKRCATSAWPSSLSRLLPSSRRMSSTRVRFSRVSPRRFSVSRRRSLYLDTPAASSRKIRMSSGLASMIREIMPCPMMA